VPAYVIAQVAVTDRERYKDYQKNVAATIAAHGGRYLARGGDTIVLEGADQPWRMVVIEFPSLQKAREWYFSAEYQQLKPVRQDSATGTLVAVEGL
jgi:uncharacterized protein (DUF1330 family)